jgi:hypothetical protein
LRELLYKCKVRVAKREEEGEEGRRGEGPLREATRCVDELREGFQEFGVTEEW